MRLFPPPDAEPREGLRQLRRLELVYGVISLVLGAVTWGDGWWSWAILGLGVLLLSPWPGIGAIQRKYERDPSRFPSAQERRERAQNAWQTVVPMVAVAAAVGGYISGGWIAAAVCGVLGAVGGAIGSRRARR